MIISVGKNKYTLEDIILIIVLFSLLRFVSPIFINGTAFASIYTLVSEFISAIILFYYFVTVRKICIPFICVGSFHLVRAVTTLLASNGNIRRVIMVAYPILALVALIEIMARNDKLELLLQNFNRLLVLLCGSNALLSIFYKPFHVSASGAETFLLGGENQIVFSYIVSAVLVALLNGFGIKCKLYYLILTVSIVKIFSAGNLMGWLFFIVLVIYFQTNKAKEAIHWLVILITSWLGIVVFRVQNLFSWLIVDILHKNLTFTNRTLIWDVALSGIVKKPILGYGVQDTVNLFYIHLVRVGHPTVDSFFSAHNQTIQTLYESGIISVAIIIIFAFIVLKRADLSNKSNVAFSVIVAGIVGVSVSLMAEAPGWDSLFVLLSIGYFIFKKPLQDRNIYAY